MRLVTSRLILCGNIRQATRASDFGDRTELVPPYGYIQPTAQRGASHR
ncbi:hypothetical protein [Brevundimonas variabilis]|uniref:Uncharacterized protein n=1 Tax=Brevundimonas variabilis TaxID=74312 RepID=A0A7W9CK56_9CAUL|nr:hypothetical protein [Brevundimonas variabilis]MBB5747084.1 hypothetical protein [Brevundimonas variabilis]